MSLSFNSSLSGVRAGMDALSVSAHNLANVNTDGFKKKVVDLSEDANGGVSANISESTSPGPTYLDKNDEIVEGSNVDISEEAVNQITARNFISSNLAVIARTDEALESLFDIMA